MQQSGMLIRRKYYNYIWRGTMKTSIVFNIGMVFPLLFSSLIAFAQEASEQADASGVLEEVTVTATRRGEADILTTPISMTKLVGDEVTKYALRDLNDIAVSVPGLSAGTVSAFKSAQFAPANSRYSCVVPSNDITPKSLSATLSHGGVKTKSTSWPSRISNPVYSLPANISRNVPIGDPRRTGIGRPCREGLRAACRQRGARDRGLTPHVQCERRRAEPAGRHEPRRFDCF